MTSDLQDIPDDQQLHLENQRLRAEVERLLRVRDSAQALIDYEDAGPDSDSGDWMYWEEKFYGTTCCPEGMWLHRSQGVRKQRSKEEVDQAICWLTGYDQEGLQRQLDHGVDFEAFFSQAPAIHPNAALIEGVVCGVRVEDVEDPLVQKIRYLGKLVDELTKGTPMSKILRQ